MTAYLDLKPGDRVRVSADIPYLPKGIAGTVARVTDGTFVHVDWDDPGYNDGAWHITNLERIAESDYESLADDRGTDAPEETPEAVSGGSVDSQAVVYVSGPMTGYPDYNFPAFDDAAMSLRSRGWEVLNPADKGVIDGWSWSDYLRYDLAEIAKADAIYTLPGWRQSKGANLEMHVARELGIAWLNPDDDADEVEESLAALAEECEGDFAKRFITGEVRTVSETGGAKGSKPERYDLLPWDAVDDVARVYGFGAKKYDDHNWRRGYDWKWSIAAAFRHLRAFAVGEDYDPESGELHPAHAVFHMLALIAWHHEPERFARFDTRYKSGLFLP